MAIWIRAILAAGVGLIVIASASLAQNRPTGIPCMPLPPPMRGVKTPKWDCWPSLGLPAKALSYKDAETKILFYVESDGRHLAAMDENGRLLWVRTPANENSLYPTRTATPIIAELGPANPLEIKGLIMAKLLPNPSEKYIEVTFALNQFGFVNERTGDFVFGGQN